MPDIQTLELNGAEDWREYDFAGRVYRIEKPVRVFMRSGGSTHRIEDEDGIFHVVPSPGIGGCVIRFSGKVIA